MNIKYSLLAILSVVFSLTSCISDKTSTTTTPSDSLVDTTSSDTTQIEWPAGKFGLKAYHVIAVQGQYGSITRFPSMDSLQKWDTTQWWSSAVLPSDCKPVVIQVTETSVNKLYFPDTLVGDTIKFRSYMPGNASGSTETGACMLQEALRTHEQLYCWNDSLSVPTVVWYTGQTYRPDWPCASTTWSSYDATTGVITPYIWTAP